MCGIAGVFDRDNRFGINAELMKSMTDMIVHRGPDAEGYFMTDRIGFGFRRLSIIDLKGGAQPMFNEDGSIVLVCNGEIYNYRELRKELVASGHVFRTNCDVEVVLHLYEEYGPELLNRLNGQFAICIYDKSKQRLFLARDQTGIAPLFYTVSQGVFIFASEIKAILKHPAVKVKVNLAGLDQLLSFPGTVSPTTMFEGIYSLAAGHYMYVDGEGEAIREYWDLDYPRETDAVCVEKDEYYIEHLKELLKTAVSYRLNADVPVGFYLSGGLDSSLIAALMGKADAGMERHSFSIGFPDSAIDERRYRALMQPLTGARHHELLFDWEDIESRLRTAVFHAESPLKETYNTCSLALSEEVRKSNIKVILTGEGADELFAGYVGYRFDEERLKRTTGFTDYEEAMERQIRQQLWGREDFIYEKDYFSFSEIKRSLYSDEVNACYGQFDSVREGLVNKARLAGRNALHVRSYLDFKLRLSDHLVADHGDRVSYANSVEARYPFLDINVIDFVRKIPPGLKLRNLVEKYILKKCAEPYLPSQIIQREKFSFVAPGSHYLIGKNIEWIEDTLSYATIKRQGYFNPDTVERLKRIYRSGKFSLNQTFETDLLMIVLTFGLFIETFQPGNN